MGDSSKVKSSEDASIDSSENGNLSIDSKPSSPQTMEAHMTAAADDDDASTGVSNGDSGQLQVGATAAVDA